MIMILVGPSGAGKTTIANKLLTKNYGLKKVITCTSRAPREKEVDGVDYYFKTKEEFEKGVRDENFLEHVQYCGNFYGTLKETVKTAAESSEMYVMVLDIRGARTLKKLYQEKAITVYINRPYRDLVEELLKRNVPDSDKLCRISNLGKDIDSAVNSCDYVVDNLRGNIKGTINQIVKIIREV